MEASGKKIQKHSLFLAKEKYHVLKETAAKCRRVEIAPIFTEKKKGEREVDKDVRGDTEKKIQ